MAAYLIIGNVVFWEGGASMNRVRQVQDKVRHLTSFPVSMIGPPIFCAVIPDARGQGGRIRRAVTAGSQHIQLGIEGELSFTLRFRRSLSPHRSRID